MTANELNSQLTEADQDWADGRLVRARDLYEQILASSPKSWHAAFQMAWIDAAFGPIDRERLADLDRDGLSPISRELLAILKERIEDQQPDENLPGTIADWDIECLRGKANAIDYRWWEECAQRATEAGQWGLAQACYEEAGVLMPGLYYDPPPSVQGIPSQVEAHLDALQD